MASIRQAIRPTHRSVEPARLGSVERERLCEALALIGIDADVVPADFPIVIRGDEITFRVYEVSDDGTLVRDEHMQPVAHEASISVTDRSSSGE